jgi:DNA-binding NarL/FixJ family response regulator
VPLTQRELEVLALICDGLSTKEIATKLAITFKTAACHRGHVMGKVGVHNAVELLRWAIKNGYVEIELPAERLHADAATTSSS